MTLKGYLILDDTIKRGRGTLSPISIKKLLNKILKHEKGIAHIQDCYANDRYKEEP